MATIRGCLEGMAGDTLYLTHWVDAVSEPRYDKIFPKYERKIVVNKDGTFAFKIPVTRAVEYISLVSSQTKTSRQTRQRLNNGSLVEVSHAVVLPVINLAHYLIEPGDEIDIQFLLGSMEFHGKGAAKFRCQSEINHLRDISAPFVISVGDTSSISHGIKFSQQMRKSSIEVLNKYRQDLSPFAFEVLTADLTAIDQYLIYDIARRSYFTDGKQNEMLSFYRFHLLGNDQSIEMTDISEEAKGSSRYYAGYINRKLSVDSEYSFRISQMGQEIEFPHHIKRRVDAALKLESSFLRDKVLTLICNDMLKLVEQEAMEEIFGRVLPNLKDEKMFSIVKRFQRDFSRGELAYNFNVEDVDGKSVRLSDFRGKAVFVDLWFTGCGACKQVAIALRDTIEPYFAKNEEVVFLSISIDRDRCMWLNSISENVVHDPSSKSRQLGAHFSGHNTVYLRTLNGYSDSFVEKYVTGGYPTLMLIDKQGRVHSFAAQRPDGGRAQLLIDQIEKLLDLP